MERNKLGKMKNLHLNLFVAVLGVWGVLGKATDVSSNVSFTMEPSNLCLYYYPDSVSPSVFYCKVDGLTEDMEVGWLRNEALIEPVEYELGDFALLGNQTEGIYDLGIQRRITRDDDRSRYSCAVYLVNNSSDPSEWILLRQSQIAKLKVSFYVPSKKYPECSIRVLGRSSPSTPEVETAAYEEDLGFTIVCCSETVNPELELVWFRENKKGLTELAGKNASRKTEKDRNVCLTYDVTNHQIGDMYSCHLTIPKVQIKNKCRKEFKVSNTTDWFQEQRRRCSFGDRGIKLVQQNPSKVEHDATFTCYSKEAIEYLWKFSPRLDQKKNQYHVSMDGSTVLLNLDSLTDIQYNITCTAIGTSNMGSRSLTIQISQPDTALQNIITIVAITLGVLVILVMILLVSYVIKTRLLSQCKDHPRGLSPQEMRARIQIRRNVAGNGGGLYSYPSSRMTSSSITPLMEGPEDSGSTVEHERPPSPRPPPPGMLRSGLARQLPVQGAVGGIILDEEEMVECEYRDESEEELELDPKSMNVEGLQYADLEFSEDEEFVQDPDEDGDDSESGDELEGAKKNNGAPVEKPRIDYANIVHFDPRRNSDPRRDSESRQNSESCWNSADPWRKNTNI